MIVLEVEANFAQLERYVISIISNLEGIDQLLDEDLRQSLDEIVAYAKVYAPVDTGRLRDSIRYEQQEPLSYAIIADPRNPKTGRGYAVYPEYGTSKMPAQPYMRPALNEGLPKLLDMLKRDVGELFLRR